MKAKLYRMERPLKCYISKLGSSKIGYWVRIINALTNINMHMNMNLYIGLTEGVWELGFLKYNRKDGESVSTSLSNTKDALRLFYIILIYEIVVCC